MSDSEADTFDNLPAYYQLAQKLDYQAPGEGHIFKKPRLTLQSTIESFVSNELILSGDSASQVLPNLSIITDSSHSNTSLTPDLFKTNNKLYNQ